MFLILVAIVLILIATVGIIGTVIGAVSSVVGLLFSGPVLAILLLGGGLYAGKKGVKQLTR